MTSVDDILELVELVGELRRLDRTKRVFGAGGPSGHEYFVRGSLTEDEIESYERQFELTLPQDYRLFLLHFGDGGAGPSYGVERLWQATYGGDVRSAFPWVESKTLDTEEDFVTWGRMPGIICLSHAGCGMYVFLVVRGAAYGNMWCAPIDGATEVRSLGSTFFQWYRSWAIDALNWLSDQTSANNN